MAVQIYRNAPEYSPPSGFWWLDSLRRHCPRQSLPAAVSYRRRPFSRSNVIAREISLLAARQKGRCCDADDCTSKDIARDYLARPGRRKNGRLNQRRRAASEHRGELKADRRAAVAQPRRKTLNGECRRWPPHQIVESVRNQDRQHD